MITIEEIPVDRINEYWDIHYRYLIEDGLVTSEEDKEYFKGDEYRNRVRDHMLYVRDRVHVIYFVRDGVRIGACHYSMLDSRGGQCYILDFWVFPEFRGNGTGHDCFRALFDYTREDGAQSYILNYVKSDSHRFWLSLGFEDIGTDDSGTPMMLLTVDEDLF